MQLNGLSRLDKSETLDEQSFSMPEARGDPWSAAVGPFNFSGLPPTVQLFAPLTLLPEEVAVWLGFFVAVASAAKVFVLPP